MPAYYNARGFLLQQVPVEGMKDSWRVQTVGGRHEEMEAVKGEAL